MKAAVRTKFAWILLIVGVAAIAGCVEEKKEYTINPDGSGKVDCDIVFAPFNLNLDGGEDASSESQVKEAVEKILDDSKGVDAWQNVSFELTDEGKIHFIGTAYFADINKVKIKSGGFNSNQSTIFSRDGAGRITIEIKGDSDSEDSGEKDKEAEKLTEAEVSQKVKEMRLQYNKSKPMMMGMLGTLKSEKVFHLPGRIEEVSNFTKVDASTVKLTLEGAKMLAAMDKVMANDKLLAEQVRAGKNPMKSGGGDELRGNEMFYGQRAPVRVVAVGGKELFDYKAEVATAKANYKAMLKGLGFGETSLAVMATATVDTIGEAGSVVVGGVRLIRYADKDRGIRPFNYDKGYALSLVMELPEPDMEITIGRVEKATADTGQDLLPKKEWDRKISWPKLTKDGKGVTFEVKLLLPGDNVKGLAEVSGSFDFLKSTGTKEVDLGMMDFKDGSQSKVEGFSISSVKTEDWDKDNQKMRLKVDLLRGAFKSVKFYGENGEELDVSSAGTSFSNGRLRSIYFKTKGSFPERGRIVLETLKDVSKHRIGFKLSNVSLLGVPLD